MNGGSPAAGRISDLHPSGWGHTPQALQRFNELNPGATYQVPLKLKKGQRKQRYKTLPLVMRSSDQSMYSVISQWAEWEDGRLVARGLRVLRLAERAGVSKREVPRGNRRLEAAGFISVWRDDRGRNVYEILPTAKIPAKAEREAAIEDARKQGGRPPKDPPITHDRESPLKQPMTGSPGRGTGSPSGVTGSHDSIRPSSKTFSKTTDREVVQEESTKKRDPAPSPSPGGTYNPEERQALDDEVNRRYAEKLATGEDIRTPAAWKKSVRVNVIAEGYLDTWHDEQANQRKLQVVEDCTLCDYRSFMLDEYDEPALFDWLGESGARPMKCQHAGPEANEAYVENERAKAAEESWSPRYPISEITSE